MTNIIWVGNRYFAPFINRHNFIVHFIDFGPGEYFNWQTLNAKHPITPADILVVADKSLPPPVLGVEKFPCLTVLYVVDSHVHSWFPYYAQAFDLCLVSLKDHLDLFGHKYLLPEQIHWLPPYCLKPTISPDSPLAADKKWDLLFVGTIDPQVNPERVEFIREVQGLLPFFHHCQGDYAALYPQARLVLNHSIAGDLNFRVFEALGCGACLLTPRIGHGLEELFTPGQDLFVFDQGDLPQLARLASALLQDEQLRLNTARNGFNKVNALHRGQNRADEFLDIIDRLRATGEDKRFVKRRQDAAAGIQKHYLRLIYLHLAENIPEAPVLRQAYLAAAAKSD